ncbi:hypothetical protein LEP1GSC043_4408 [Leptospira weilii str. Ecochallenge]|uniref:Uncharacterized protein n=1 Tax=Leptospira weilii str. Ecochallenge TaxID=1049986 RepID=N1UBX8_9LEPT|nr:hypothetical protein LEP1GSC043_4408 [Leptospira weilii str. Ecochallenge]
MCFSKKFKSYYKLFLSSKFCRNYDKLCFQILVYKDITRFINRKQRRKYILTLEYALLKRI